MKYAFDNANLIDGTQDMRVQPGLCVLTDGETITDIVPAGTAPAGYTRIDLHKRYLLPGLINMHVHLAGNGKIQKKQRDLETLVRRILSNPVSRAVAYRMVCSFARTELLGGVTTIRTVGGLDTFDTRLRDEIRAGRRIGPRVLAANEAISVPGGHMAGSVAIAARTVDEALAQVDAVHAQGADLVKLMITGGVMDATERGMPGEVKMPAEMVRAVCERAHALGIPVVLGNDTSCQWVAQYDFWRELCYFHEYAGASNACALYCATGQSAHGRARRRDRHAPPRPVRRYARHERKPARGSARTAHARHGRRTRPDHRPSAPETQRPARRRTRHPARLSRGSHTLYNIQVML